MSGKRTEAAVRRSRWPGWIWSVPLAAAAIVVWLFLRHFVATGPQIAITFPSGSGLQAGSTEVRYKGVTVGKVQQITFSRDRKRVITTVQMEKSVTDLLRKGTRFWIVGANIDLTDLSTLKTLISGAYIQMAPGNGKPSRHFKGMEQPPVIQGGSGTVYVLHADKLGGIGAGTPVSYLGLRVGKVKDVHLANNGRGFRLSVYIRAPYDRLVHDGSRFWNAGALQVSLGRTGLEAKLNSAQALFTGLVAFETPAAAAAGPSSKPGHGFTLYANYQVAQTVPAGAAVRYVVRFDGAVGGLGIGAPVKLRGFTVGRVEDVSLHYDAARDLLETPVVVEIDPAALDLPESGSRSGTRLEAALRSMIEHGLRARLSRNPPVIGGRFIALEFIPDAKPVQAAGQNSPPSIPAVGGAGMRSLQESAHAVLADIRRMNLPATAKSLRETMRRTGNLVSSPRLKESLAHLDKSLANLQKITNSANGRVGPIIDSLHETAAAMKSASDAAGRVLGARPSAGGGTFPETLKEFADAARSIRALADYLDRHPEALLVGKKLQ